MNRTIRMWMLATGVVLAMIATFLIVASARDWQLATDKVEQLDLFCSRTASTAEDAARIFDSGSLELREWTAKRYATEDTMYVDGASLRTCTWALLPPFPAPCRATRDWRCLARYTRELHRALVEQPR